MAVVSHTRWSGGNRDAIVAAAKKAKTIHEKAGAEFLRLGQIQTGPHAGQWLVTVRHTDWETYGKAMQTLAGNAAWQKLLAEVGAMSQLIDRTVVVSIDL